MCRIASNFWKRYLFLIFWPDWLSILCGVPKTIIKNTSKDDWFLMTFVVSLSGFEINLKNRLEFLAQKQIPTLFVMGEKDGLFSKDKFFNTLEIIGGNREECFTNIDIDGEYESRAVTKDWIRVLNFRFGGHFCFKKCSKVFHKEFSLFFESLRL